MADFAAIAAVGKSIERLLNHRFQEDEPVPDKRTKAVLIRTADLETANIRTAIGSPALSIYVYRVDFNKMMRAAWSAVAAQDGRPRLPVDLHFLITPWADNAEHELRVLGKAMEALEGTPIMSGPLLDPSALWAGNETIQLVMEEDLHRGGHAHVRFPAHRLPPQRAVPRADRPPRRADRPARPAGHHRGHRVHPRQSPLTSPT